MFSTPPGHSPVDENLDDDINANDCIIEADELQALDDLEDSLSFLELLEEQEYDQF